MANARFYIAFALILLVSAVSGQQYVPGEVLVRFKESTPLAPGILQRLRGQVVQRVPAIGLSRIRLPAGASVPAAVSQLRSDPNVVYAEPNYIVRISGVNDPFFNRQWNLTKVAAPAAWSIFPGSADVLVAVLDTGADLTHPELVGKIMEEENFVGPGPAIDGNGHGTHTAGIVAANTDNSVGIASLGNRTRLLIGKVASDSGQGSIATVIQGIEWASDKGAKVVSMSFGLTVGSAALEDAVNDAWERGIVLVAAAGNSGTSQRNYPAAYDNCIAVAATDELDRRCSFSNLGDWVDVAAPGRNIFSLYKRGGYATISGTSMAAPQVAALAALLWGHGARYNTSIRLAIQTSGSPTTGFALHPVLRIDARRAMLRLP